MASVTRKVCRDSPSSQEQEWAKFEGEGYRVARMTFALISLTFCPYPGALVSEPRAPSWAGAQGNNFKGNNIGQHQLSRRLIDKSKS